MLTRPANTGSLSRLGTPELERPSARVVLAMRERPEASILQHYLQEEGWEVYVARTPCEARRLVRKVTPAVSILSAEYPRQESGWLTARKMLMEDPDLRVMLVGTNSSPRAERFAAFVGASGYFSVAEPLKVARAVFGEDLSPAL